MAALSHQWYKYSEEKYIGAVGIQDRYNYTEGANKTT